MSDSQTKATKYRLDVNVRIQAIDPQYGHPTSSGGLEIQERGDLTLDSFMEVAAVLARFHELTEAMRVDPHANPTWHAFPPKERPHGG